MRTEYVWRYSYGPSRNFFRRVGIKPVNLDPQITKENIGARTDAEALAVFRERKAKIARVLKKQRYEFRDTPILVKMVTTRLA